MGKQHKVEQPLRYRGGIAKGFKPLGPEVEKLHRGQTRIVFEELIRMSLQNHNQVASNITHLGDVINSITNIVHNIQNHYNELAGDTLELGDPVTPMFPGCTAIDGDGPDAAPAKHRHSFPDIEFYIGGATLEQDDEMDKLILRQPVFKLTWDPEMDKLIKVPVIEHDEIMDKLIFSPLLTDILIPS